jgi:hypothetical protein
MIKRLHGCVEPWKVTSVSAGHSHHIFDGGHTHTSAPISTKSKSLLNEINDADTVIAIHHGQAKLIQSVHNDYIATPIQQTDEVLLRELATQLFHNKLKMFQQGFVEECTEALNKIIEKHNLRKDEK